MASSAAHGVALSTIRCVSTGHRRHKHRAAIAPYALSVPDIATADSTIRYLSTGQRVASCHALSQYRASRQQILPDASSVPDIA
eukprot:3847313-Rhodomonas_salina.1